MLITDKKNRDFAYISLNDILSAMEIANEEEIKELKKLFNLDDYNENNKIKISKNSKVYNILKNNDKVIDGDYYITPSMLSQSFTIAYLEFNYEMKDRISKYLRKYVDNIAEGKSNEKLVQKILCDEKVMNYIQKYESFEDYIEHIIGTRIDKNKQVVEEIKSKSFVRITA